MKFDWKKIPFNKKYFFVGVAGAVLGALGVKPEIIAVVSDVISGLFGS